MPDASHIASSRTECVVYDRRQGRLVREPVTAAGLLRLAYARPVHRLLRPLLFAGPLASRLLGWYCDTRLSRRHIRRAIRSWGLDPAEFADPPEKFRTFNDFFTRRLRPEARPCPEDPDVLCSPADGRTLVFRNIRADDELTIKGAPWSVADLLAREEAAAAFDGGHAVVVRLAPCDYHRFHFPTAGRTIDEWEIPGGFDSVHPFALALGRPVFCRNHRYVSILELERFGRAAYVEIGAFGVGAVERTHPGGEFRKMDEKGYFRFGGSTIVLLLSPQSIRFEDDLLRCSEQDIETLVRAGDPLGRREPTADKP